MAAMYIFEVLRKTYCESDTGKTECVYKHVGYLNKTFSSLYNAKDYYNKYNEKLPKLTTKLLISSVNEETNLLYVIRRYYPGIKATIEPFEKNQDILTDWCFV
jgi:hypothetical protein